MTARICMEGRVSKQTYTYSGFAKPLPVLMVNSEKGKKREKKKKKREARYREKERKK